MFARTLLTRGIVFSVCCLMFLSVPVAGQEPTVADVFNSDEEETTPKDAKADSPSDAKNADNEDAPPPEKRKTEKYGRETPSSSVERFIDATHANDYETALNYLDLRNLPKGMHRDNGPEYAQQLEVILDRGLWVDVDTLSSDPEGFHEDGLPKFRDLLGTVELRGQSIDILLQRVPGDEKDRVWKFSNATVADIPRLHKVYGYGEYGEWLAEHLPDYSFLGLVTWQWIVLIGLFVAGYLGAVVLTWPVFYLLKRRGSTVGRHAAELLARPLRLVLMAFATKHWFEIVRPSVEARAIAEANTLVTIIVIWLVFRIIDLVKLHYATARDAGNREYVSVLLRPAATAAKIVIAIVALMTWVENLGFKATTLIAGLGVGGLAVALAAQRSIENLIGAITLYMSAPVKVGDTCRFGDKQGVIEEINLRATRIRTLERTVIAVPNSVFSEMHLENISKREKIRYNPDLCLQHATTADQVRQVLDGIRSDLAGRSNIDQDNHYVRFKGFGERGLDFKTLIYVITQDYEEYLGVAEELNLMIMDTVAQAGTALAEPITLHREDEGKR